MNLACAKTVVNFIDGGAYIFCSFDAVLIKGHLRVGVTLELVESDADNAYGARKLSEKSTSMTANILISSNSAFEEDGRRK